MVRSSGLTLNPDTQQTASEILEIDDLFNTLSQWNNYLEKDVPFFQGGPK